MTGQCNQLRSASAGMPLVDTSNPDQFNNDEYRYQLFARPPHYECKEKDKYYKSNPATTTYQPAYTDVRALQQTMYIPIVPSQPGGSDLTFPMTPQTMGQPDVTSACCVPVIPSLPGYKNLTEGILPGPCAPLNGSTRGPMPSVPTVGYPQQPQQMRSTGRGHDGGCGCGTSNVYPQQQKGCGCAHCAPQTTRPPSNVAGGSFVGVPDTFPATMQNLHSAATPTCSYVQNMTPVPTLQLPHYTGDVGQQNTQAAQEAAATRRLRWLKEVYGHFGAYLLPNPYQKRHVVPTVQPVKRILGNHYQKAETETQQCYVQKKNMS